MLYNANSEEKNILEFWKKNKIFERSITERPADKPYAFYDGPPFATGTPHYGHLVGSTMKDIIPRYHTMQGKRVERVWGWDCHGLPIENIVEKELGISTKKELEEKIGVARFNQLCRERVLGYVDEWRTVIERLGRWVDMDNAYRTMDRSYMESVWWVFKQLYDKGYLYESFRSMHICPRCETTLSQSEVTEGYKEVKDISVVAKFGIRNWELGMRVVEEMSNGYKCGFAMWADNSSIISRVACSTDASQLAAPLYRANECAKMIPRELFTRAPKPSLLKPSATSLAVPP